MPKHVQKLPAADLGTMGPILLALLLLLEPATLQGTPVEDWADGRYSLSFIYTGQSKPRPGSPSFQAVIFLNDQPFFRYDSTHGRAEPLGPWAELEGLEDWEKESQLQKARGDYFLVTLEEAIDYYKDAKVPHTFQGRIGCELQNNVSSGSFWSYAYDGRDFITFNRSIPAWVVLDPAAAVAKRKWEAEAVYLERAKAYMEEECPALLQKYLRLGQSLLDRRDLPLVSVTSHKTSGQQRRLECLAHDFYPPGITLHWTRAGKTLETESMGDLLPNGNGTYQTRLELSVPLSDRGPLACHVKHSSLAQPITVQWDPDQKA